MANFIPLKNYFFYCLDQLMLQYKLTPSFLDVGCGIGELSKYVASKGWKGKAIDFSEEAIEKARHNLLEFSQVEVVKKSLFDENGFFKTIFLWDVIEHIENDEAVLKKLCSLLLPEGYLVITVPSNPSEWRWDDDFYGHLRRYSIEEIETKLTNAGFVSLLYWDCSYPLFWFMRRIYTRFKACPENESKDNNKKTKISVSRNAWNIPVIADCLNANFFLWKLLYSIQFKFFKNKLKDGFEIFILAKKAD